MKKERSLLLFAAVLTAASITFLMGCKGEEGPAAPAAGTSFETLTTYMVENGMDIPDILSGWIIDDSTLAADRDDYYIMDVRRQGDYDNLGHIEGAVSSSPDRILMDAANSGGKTIVVASYTGLASCYAVVALRLSGYPDAKTLKWGMSSWNEVFDEWSGNIDSIADGHANWTTGATATPQEFNAPVFIANAADGPGILAERVIAMLNAGFKGIDAAAVLDAPGGYFINNYWAQADVDKYGHIAGAYRINENLSIAGGGFKNLDPGKTVVTYCWTGQTASIITAYLTVLGYDARVLEFGTNAMIYNILETKKWGGSNDHPYVTTEWDQ